MTIKYNQRHHDFRNGLLYSNIQHKAAQDYDYPLHKYDIPHVDRFSCMSSHFRLISLPVPIASMQITAHIELHFNFNISHSLRVHTQHASMVSHIKNGSDSLSLCCVTKYTTKLTCVNCAFTDDIAISLVVQSEIYNKYTRKVTYQPNNTTLHILPYVLFREKKYHI